MSDFAAIVLFFVVMGCMLAWVIYAGARGERRLAELMKLSHLETQSTLKQMERNGAEAERDRREHQKKADLWWHDHEVLMRMVLERTDRGGGAQGSV